MIDSGTVLQGRFLIEEKIGVGGMGAVYRAIDQKFGSRVAIKETFYGHTDLGEAFEREARLLNGLHHAILPHVSDYFSENNGHFLVMEYIEGEDLSEILKRGEVFPVATIVGWAFDLLDGLDYLHLQNPPVIHRDIKPSNLKLTSRGKIMLLDFGMAKETSSNTLAAQSVFGYSKRYSPLEQIEGTGTDERSDIFSLGATVYHLITGKAAIDVLARVSAIVAGRPDPLQPANAINPEVPAAVAAILSSALALSAENRFESARAMSNALEHVMSASAAEQVRQKDSMVPLAASSAVAASAVRSAPPVVTAGAAPVALEDSKFGQEIDISEPEGFDTNPNPKEAAERTSSTGGFFPGRENNVSANAQAEPFRVRRSSAPSYAIWLSVLVLCIAVVLDAAYRGLPSTGSNVSTETAEIASTEGTAVVDQAPSSSSIGETDQDVKDGVLPAVEKSVDIAAERNTPGAATRQSVSKLSAEEAREGPVNAVPARKAERRAPMQNAVDRPSRRIVRPAFDQPSVSSIEMIMTGIPYERRGRYDDRDDWLEEERRERRRLRRAMRRNGPPF